MTAGVFGRPEREAARTAADEARMRRAEMGGQQQRARVGAMVQQPEARGARGVLVLAKAAVQLGRINLDRLVQHIRRAYEALAVALIDEVELRRRVPGRS